MAKSVSQKLLIGMVLFIGGAIVGAAGVHDFDSEESAKATQNMSDSTRLAAHSADFRATLVMLATEHMTYTDKAIDAVFNGGGTSVALNALYANSAALSKDIDDATGGSSNRSFDTIWRMHIDDFVKYAVADSRNDVPGKVAALSAADADCATPLATYLSTLAPSLSEATLEAGLRDHIAMTAKMIDYRTAGDYTNEQMELDMANTHIETLFSSLANAIVQQYPHYFLTNKG